MDNDLAAEIAAEYEQRNLEVPPAGAIQQLVGNIEAGNRSMDDLRHALDRSAEKRAEANPPSADAASADADFEGSHTRGKGGRFMSRLTGGDTADEPTDPDEEQTDAN